jgi:glyoxylate reductase
MVKRNKVLVTRILPKPGMELLAEHFDLIVNEKDRTMPKKDLLSHIPDCDGLICLLTDNIDKDIIRAGKKLKAIANYAVGYNNIDIEEATKHRIAITNTPGVLTETTADLTFALLLSAARRIPGADAYTRQGKFAGWSPMLFLGHDIYAKNIGIIGFGRIGKAVARRARGFCMRVLYNDTARLSDKEEKELLVEYQTIDDLLKSADFVCVHVPLNEQTYHLITLEKIAMMKSSSYIINVSRGAVIDENALVHALGKNMIAGCALDVYENEPMINKKLLSMRNTVLVPHIGSASIQTRVNMAMITAHSLISILIEKTRALNTVNPQVYV